MTTTTNSKATETKTLSETTEAIRKLANKLLIAARVADEDAVLGRAIGDDHPLNVARKVAWDAWREVQTIASTAAMHELSK